MQYLTIKNLEKYHPGYKDRSLIWCKIYFSMLNSDYEFEMLDEIASWRYVKFIMLQIQTKKPVPLNESWLKKKGFDFKKQPMSVTLKMLHKFIDLVTECNETVTQSRVEKSREEEEKKPLRLHDFVLISEKEAKRLAVDYGPENCKDYTRRLNEYIGSKGDKYKSHYHTLRMWMDRDGKRRPKV